MRSVTGLLMFLLLGLSGSGAAASTVPECVDFFNRPLQINNPHVLKLRESTADQYKDRGFVQGVITQIYPDRTGHAHFAINLDAHPAGDIEIIYNQEFGQLPRLAPGMNVVACGDYITAGPRSRLPSPMGAIIHWVHYNPGDRDGGRHPHGFLLINGQPYGIN